MIWYDIIWHNNVDVNNSFNKLNRFTIHIGLYHLLLVKNPHYIVLCLLMEEVIIYHEFQSITESRNRHKWFIISLAIPCLRFMRSCCLINSKSYKRKFCEYKSLGCTLSTVSVCYLIDFFLRCCGNFQNM